MNIMLPTFPLEMRKSPKDAYKLVIDMSRIKQKANLRSAYDTLLDLDETILHNSELGYCQNLRKVVWWLALTQNAWYLK